MTTRRPLRWGGSRSRAIGGVALIVSGGVAIAGSDTYVLLLLLAGTVAHVTGWCVMPADGWRRVTAAALSTPAVWLLLTGPRFIAVLVLPYIGWLLVRHRPLRSYPTITFVLAGAVILPSLFSNYSQMLPAVAIEFAVIVASAWAAWAVATTRDSRHLPEQYP
ncbi:hypothetical protein ACFPJ4_11385 [Lysinimonas soli]|uniref:Uncharacterized protein n=1 Tax=Lysinimonas soli TaxID=1074233 RepID=A0ABW0NSU8_9MICO